MAAIPLFWYTNMAAVTSCENDLLLRGLIVMNAKQYTVEPPLTATLASGHSQTAVPAISPLKLYNKTICRRTPYALTQECPLMEITTVIRFWATHYTGLHNCVKFASFVSKMLDRFFQFAIHFYPRHLWFKTGRLFLVFDNYQRNFNTTEP